MAKRIYITEIAYLGMMVDRIGQILSTDAAVYMYYTIDGPRMPNEMLEFVQSKKIVLRKTQSKFSDSINMVSYEIGRLSKENPGSEIRLYGPTELTSLYTELIKYDPGLIGTLFQETPTIREQDTQNNQSGTPVKKHMAGRTDALDQKMGEGAPDEPIKIPRYQQDKGKQQNKQRPERPQEGGQRPNTLNSRAPGLGGGRQKVTGMPVDKKENRVNVQERKPEQDRNKQPKVEAADDIYSQFEKEWNAKKQSDKTNDKKPKDTQEDKKNEVHDAREKQITVKNNKDENAVNQQAGKQPRDNKAGSKEPGQTDSQKNGETGNHVKEENKEAIEQDNKPASKQTEFKPDSNGNMGDTEKNTKKPKTEDVAETHQAKDADMPKIRPDKKAAGKHADASHDTEDSKTALESEKDESHTTKITEEQQSSKIDESAENGEESEDEYSSESYGLIPKADPAAEYEAKNAKIRDSRSVFARAFGGLKDIFAGNPDKTDVKTQEDEADTENGANESKALGSENKQPTEDTDNKSERSDNTIQIEKNSTTQLNKFLDSEEASNMSLVELFEKTLSAICGGDYVSKDHARSVMYAVMSLSGTQQKQNMNQMYSKALKAYFSPKKAEYYYRKTESNLDALVKLFEMRKN